MIAATDVAILTRSRARGLMPLLVVSLCCGAVSACNENLCADKAALQTALDACYWGGNWRWPANAANTCAAAGISNWNVAAVTDMSNIFNGRYKPGTAEWVYMTSFNDDISSWDVGSVTNMLHMFTGATSFNRDLSSWDVGEVTTMAFMF